MSTEPINDELRILMAQVAEEAADRAVQKTLLSIGMDISDAQGVIRTQRAVDFMYQSQDMSALIKKYGMGAVITTVAAAALTMLWFGFQVVINKGP